MFSVVPYSFIGAFWNRRLYFAKYPDVSPTKLKDAIEDSSKWYEFTFTADDEPTVISEAVLLDMMKSGQYDSIYEVVIDRDPKRLTSGKVAFYPVEAVSAEGPFTINPTKVEL